MNQSTQRENINMPINHRLVSFALTIILALFVAPNTFAYDSDDYSYCVEEPAYLLRDQEFQEYQYVINECQRFYNETGTSPPTRPAPRAMSDSEMVLGGMLKGLQQWQQMNQGTNSYGTRYGGNEQLCVSDCIQEQTMCHTTCLQEGEFGTPAYQACINQCGTDYHWCLNTCK